MSNRKTTIVEAPAKVAEQVQAATEGEVCPCVYCGPSVRGVARQYTVFSDGKLPKALQEFIEKRPAVAALVVAVGLFADMRRKVETPGTAENLLFNSIKSNL